ncbi:MAG: ATP synthase F1 subunit gamma [Candidatus Kerfeldbacteria bacterium]
MPLATKEIKRRLRSISSTKKITKAMELVAASKMRKAVKSVLETRHYANTAWDIVKNLSAKTDASHHPLLERKESKDGKIGIIMINSNRGLCGGFNREIVEKVAGYLDKKKKEKNIEEIADIFLMGDRGKDIMHQYNHKIIANFPKPETAESVTEISAIAKMVITDYLSGKYERVVIAYTDYKSAVSQEAYIRKLLPISKEDNELGHVIKDKKDNVEAETTDLEYTFEPSPDVVLDQMLHRLIELQVYQALLESNASEHSSRMVAMRNASDAAGDMIDDLNLTFNQARQQAITSEIAEISAGAAAVK